MKLVKCVQTTPLSGTPPIVTRHVLRPQVLDEAEQRDCHH
jgi:hypothetical protein